MSRPSLEPPLPARSPWQRFYRRAHAARRRWYATRSHRLPCPVISVGNLHWGGGGKTPLVAALASHLHLRGHALAILSRGYRGHGSGTRIVSTGEGPRLSPEDAGDEPVFLADQLPGVAVVVDAERYQAGRIALSALQPTPEILLLDDGFSHLRLQRNLDILAFPAADPFAGGRLPPAGRLREPLESTRHAHAVLLTGSSVGEDDGRLLAEGLRAYGFTGPGFSCPTTIGKPAVVGGEALPEGSRVLLVAGIARPRDFVEAASRLDVNVVGKLLFRDHHSYPPAALRRIADAWRRNGADYVLTTGKDRIKLAGRLGAPLAELPIRAAPESAFWDWLHRRLFTLGVGKP